MTSSDASESRELTDVVTRLRRALRRSIRSDYPWESLPMAQVEVLQTIAEIRTARVGDLVGQLRLAQSTVSTVVGRLMDAGLIARAADPTDRRAAVVTLTAEGRKSLRAWDTAHRRRLDAALNSLSRRDHDAVVRALPALGRLVDALEE